MISLAGGWALFGAYSWMQTIVYILNIIDFSHLLHLKPTEGIQSTKLDASHGQTEDNVKTLFPDNTNMSQ